MLKNDFLVPYCMETVGVKSPGLKDAYCKLSDTLVHMGKFLTPHFAPAALSSEGSQLVHDDL